MISKNDSISIMKKDIIQKLNQLSDRINIQQRDELFKDIVKLKLTENYSEFIKIKDKWNI
jgi:metal-responsive CopG/Arc/MetJ family transcriptional regulator